jgi:hypothetical protein
MSVSAIPASPSRMAGRMVSAQHSSQHARDAHPDRDRVQLPSGNKIWLQSDSYSPDRQRIQVSFF